MYVWWLLIPLVYSSDGQLGLNLACNTDPIWSGNSPTSLICKNYCQESQLCTHWGMDSVSRHCVLFAECLELISGPYAVYQDPSICELSNQTDTGGTSFVRLLDASIFQSENITLYFQFPTAYIMEALYFGSETMTGEDSCASYPSACAQEVHWRQLETVGCISLFEGTFRLKDVYRPHSESDVAKNDLHFTTSDNVLESQLRVIFSEPMKNEVNDTTVREWELNFSWSLVFSSRIQISLVLKMPRPQDCEKCDIVRTFLLNSGEQENLINEMTGIVTIECDSVLRWPWKIRSGGNITVEAPNSEDFTDIVIDVLADCPGGNSENNCVQSWALYMHTDNVCNTHGEYIIHVPIVQASDPFEESSLPLEVNISHLMPCGELDTDSALDGLIHLMDSDYYTPYLGTFFNLGSDAYFNMDVSGHFRVANISVIDLSLELENEDRIHMFGYWQSFSHRRVLLRHEPEYYDENKVRWSLHIDREFFEPIIDGNDGKMWISITVVVTFVDIFKLPFRRRLSVGYDFSKLLYLLPFMCKGDYDHNGAFPGQYVSYQCPQGGTMFVYCDIDGWNLEKSRDEGCTSDEEESSGSGSKPRSTTHAPTRNSENMTMFFFVLILFGVCTASLLFWYCFSFTSREHKRRRRIKAKTKDANWALQNREPNHHHGEHEMNMNMHGDITVQIPPGSTDNKVVEGGMMVPGMNGMNMNEQMMDPNGMQPGPQFMQQQSTNPMIQIVGPPGGPPPPPQMINANAMSRSYNANGFPQIVDPNAFNPMKNQVPVNGIRKSKSKKKKKKKKHRKSLQMKNGKKKKPPSKADHMRSLCQRHAFWNQINPVLQTNILTFILQSVIHYGGFTANVCQDLQMKFGLNETQIGILSMVYNTPVPTPSSASNQSATSFQSMPSASVNSDGIIYFQQQPNMVAPQIVNPQMMNPNQGGDMPMSMHPTTNPVDHKANANLKLAAQHAQLNAMSSRGHKGGMHKKGSPGRIRDRQNSKLTKRKKKKKKHASKRAHSAEPVNAAYAYKGMNNQNVMQVAQPMQPMQPVTHIPVQVHQQRSAPHKRNIVLWE